ncbi:MAG: TonB-dependent receptor plug domain-containing protein [Gammaproteobacteria bacterium]
MKRLNALTLLLFCGLAPAISPGADAFLTEAEILADIPLVITASRLLQTPSMAPASVTVIDREMIEASTALEIPDLLRLVPGFQVTYPNGNITSVTYHGNEDAWSNRMQVLIDGRSVYSPLFSIVDWTHLDIDIDDIERIEVIRGPNAPVYGSNAFLSTVNIITRQPFQDRGLTAKATKGSLDTREGMLRYSGSSGELDYRMTASHHEDDGFEDVNDNKSLNSVSLRAVYDVTPGDNVDVQMGLTQGPEGAWGQSPATSPDRDKQTRSFFVYSRWRHVLSPMSEVHVQAYSNYLDWSDNYEIGPLSALFGVNPALIPVVFGQPDQTLSLSRYDGTVRRHDIEIQHTLAPGDDWRLVWGASYRIDTLESFQILGSSEPRSDYIRRLFTNLEWRVLDPMTVNAGAMIEDNGIIGTHVSPRLAANYELFANQTLRAVATRALRSPSIYENYEFNVVRFGDGTILDIQFISEQNIEAETIESYELGYRGLFPDADLEIDLKVYQEHMDDIITHPRDLTYPDLISPLLPDDQETGSFVRVNDGYVDTAGAEIQVMYRPGRRTLLSLQYAYADAGGRILRVIEGDQPVRYNERINEATPAHTLSILSSHAFNGGIQASVAYFYLSATDWGGDGDSLPSYSRWDAKLAKRFSLGGLEASISLLVQNLLDEEYAEFRDENIFDRRTYLQLGVKM